VVFSFFLSLTLAFSAHGLEPGSSAQLALGNKESFLLYITQDAILDYPVAKTLE
jgi:hypothetical protein